MMEKMSGAKPHRLAVLTGIPAPYREPIFAKLARHPEIELKVFYCATGHDNVAWTESAATPEREYPLQFLRNCTPARFRRLPIFGYANLGVVSEFRRFAPTHALIYGYNQLAHWLGFGYCLVRGIPFSLRSDSNIHLDGSTTWQSKARRAVIRPIVRQAHSILAVGSTNRDYWRAYGAQERQIQMAPFAIDNERATNLAGRRQPNPSGQLRFLYVGRLIPRKGVENLILAFNEIADRAELIIVGDGPERDRLIQLQTSVAREKTTWVGKTSNDQAIARMGQADVLVLPAKHEPWGLVVNEAFAAGLPVIAHSKVGAAVDLVLTTGAQTTGRVFHDHTPAAIVQELRYYLEDPDRARRDGQNAQRKIQAWSFDRVVAEIVESCRRAARTRPIHSLEIGTQHA